MLALRYDSVTILLLHCVLYPLYGDIKSYIIYFTECVDNLYQSTRTQSGHIRCLSCRDPIIASASTNNRLWRHIVLSREIYALQSPELIGKVFLNQANSSAMNVEHLQGLLATSNTEWRVARAGASGFRNLVGRHVQLLDAALLETNKKKAEI